jgi:hypothetical protein
MFWGRKIQRGKEGKLADFVIFNLIHEKTFTILLLLLSRQPNKWRKEKEESKG